MAALRLLNVLHYSVHPALDQLWSKQVPLLVEHIEGRKGSHLLQTRLLVPRNRAGTAHMPDHPENVPFPVLLRTLITLVPLIPTRRAFVSQVVAPWHHVQDTPHLRAVHPCCGTCGEDEK